ncbi:hypothetical protein HDU84_003171 [Entophlyctis sp. JEL0112]|nr:hypothetical protein HDU84_003171 [Entophlyctis sp. JEL0112]
MQELAAQQAVTGAQAAVDDARAEIAQALADLNGWKLKNPDYTGNEPGFIIRIAELGKREEALAKRELALKDRELALKDRELALKDAKNDLMDAQKPVREEGKPDNAESIKEGSAASDELCSAETGPDPMAVVMETDPPVSTSPNRMTSDEFIAVNNLDLAKVEDVVKFLQFKMDQLAPYKREKPYNAAFHDSCLEGDLHERFTGEQMTFRVQNIKVLLSVAGSGKTRKLLENLHFQFGYYFVTMPQIPDFGSQDMLECFQLSALSPSDAEDLIDLLYFVRVFVCGVLLGKGYTAPHQILLAQLHPIAFFGIDIFAELFLSLALRKAKFRINLKEMNGFFDFLVIDDIQHSVFGDSLFVDSNGTPRPFFSPLLSASKRRFFNFVVSGTAISSEILQELHISRGKPHFSVSFVSNLTPLDASRAAKFIQRKLHPHRSKAEIDLIVSAVRNNPLFHGRARFVVFLVDLLLEGYSLEYALNQFVLHLFDPSDALFPLRNYVDIIEKDQKGFNRLTSSSSLGIGVIEAIGKYVINGTKFYESGCFRDQAGSDAVFFGLGFWDGCKSLKLDGLAVVECLRYFLPLAQLVRQTCRVENARSWSYVAECAVAYAFAKNHSDNTKPEGNQSVQQPQVNSIGGDLASFLVSVDYTVLFPHHCCGPDVVYKHNSTVYFINYEPRGRISKQELVNACHTTDPNFFYWNKTRNAVLVGFEKQREDCLRLLSGMNVQRVVVMQKSVTTVDTNIEVVNEFNSPKFFLPAGKDVWRVLL